jgi:hypothetical protein
MAVNTKAKDPQAFYLFNAMNIVFGTAVQVMYAESVSSFVADRIVGVLSGQELRVRI